MKRFRYAWLQNGQVDEVNRLLAQGWRPAREVPVNHSAGASGVADALVVLEREDALPLYRGELLGDAAPAEFFDDIPLFEGFAEHDLRELIAACEVGRYEAGSILFDAGDERQLIYLVREGQVSIQLLGLPLEDPVILEAGPKDVFGESTFFAPSPHTTRATAVTAVRTLELRRDRYEELLQAQRPAAYKLAVNAAQILGERLRATDQWIREILQGAQAAETMRSWRRYRHGLHGGNSSSPISFFGI